MAVNSLVLARPHWIRCELAVHNSAKCFEYAEKYIHRYGYRGKRSKAFQENTSLYIIQTRRRSNNFVSSRIRPWKTWINNLDHWPYMMTWRQIHTFLSNSTNLRISCSVKSWCIEATYIRLNCFDSSRIFSMIGWACGMLLGLPTY